MEKVKDAILLAAGNSSRMKTDDSKIFLNFLGLPMIKHMIDLLGNVSERITIVASPTNIKRIEELVSSTCGVEIAIVLQREALGTGDATEIAVKSIGEDADDVLIVNCDTPLVTLSTFEKIVNSYRKDRRHFKLKFLSFKSEDITGYGRVIHLGNSLKIIEEKELNDDQRKLYKEANAGVYIGKCTDIIDAVKKIQTSGRCERYFTDIVSLLPSSNVLLDNAEEGLGINTVKQYINVLNIAKRRIVDKHIANGVLIYDPDMCWIDQEVKIGDGVVLKGRNTLSKNTVIEDFSTIEECNVSSSTIGGNCTVRYSHVINSRIGNYTSIGPYVHIRPNSNIGDKNKIGSFVEITNSTTSYGCKIPHLSYVGKASLGKGVNFGAGSIVASYNGREKNTTEIGNNTFIGANNTLIAPISIGDNAYTAGGSTINRNVNTGELAIGRAEQVNKEYRKNPYLKKIEEK